MLPFDIIEFDRGPICRPRARVVELVRPFDPGDALRSDIGFEERETFGRANLVERAAATLDDVVVILPPFAKNGPSWETNVVLCPTLPRTFRMPSSTSL